MRIKVFLHRTILCVCILCLFAFFIILQRNTVARKLIAESNDNEVFQTEASSGLNPSQPLTVIHSPPISQSASANGKVSWYSNWKWLSSSSSSIPLDQSRLPSPQINYRAPIYTYYDSSAASKDNSGASTDINDAEGAILLTWRRAWWAQGFKPIVLGPKEAMNNALYSEAQMKTLDLGLKTQIFKWLAWESMGTGILCDYTLIPMALREDPLLALLRRGDYPKLTRFENLASGLFVGPKAEITAALKQAFNNKELESAKDFISAVTPNTFLVDPNHAALAYYDSKTISEKYPKIKDQVNARDAQGLMVLNQLIIAHLHSTWQNIFHKGIAVVKPLPSHMTVLIEPAMSLVSFLSKCPESPLPASCPPNFSQCRPCVASQPLKISTPSIYMNTSSLYTIGTVPHPRTNAILTSGSQTIDISWVRRVSDRDPWLSDLTKDLLGTGVSSLYRLSKFKQLIASDYGLFRSLWLTAEHPLPDDLEWHFGFALFTKVFSDGRSETPVPGPERRPKKIPDPRDGPVATELDLQHEQELINEIRKWDKENASEEQKSIRNAIEAWNLADTEAWKFTKALLAQFTNDRLQWEEEARNPSMRLV